MEVDAGSRTYPALRLALCGEGNSVASYWAVMLLQSPAFDVVASWAREKEEATAVASVLMPTGDGSVKAYWEDTADLSMIGRDRRPSIKPHGSRSSGLDALLQRADVDAFLLVLPPDSHTVVLEQLFRRCPCKHVFSANLPSFDPSILRQLASLHSASVAPSDQKAGIPGVWGCCSPFKNEVAVSKLQAILKDLGTIVAGELVASSMVQSVTVTSAGSFGGKRTPRTPAQQRDLLLSVCTCYSSLLRHLLGDVTSLSAVRGTNATLCGQLHFLKGASVALTVDLISKTNIFSLTVWGSKGFGRLTWNEDKKALEVQRYLHHYEHPTLHPVTGPTWEVKTWLESIWSTSKGGKVANSQRADNMLVDLVLSSSLVASDGAVVRLRLTGQREEETNTPAPVRGTIVRESADMVAAA
ncbi:hypothetical protein CSUI_003725 [Cystoisospora suis]|uniref:Uncharacterized protein n=1 Tax=Cystoisospora suis TaxID=483139 RepID=A0A2C6KEH9_9APIC|nr:hypothetical protein CSUI_003725 [Cystoisospora suis]